MGPKPRPWLLCGASQALCILCFQNTQGILSSQDLLGSGQRAGTLEVPEGHTCQGLTVPGAPTSQCLTTGNPLGAFVKATRSTGIQDFLRKQTLG